MLSGIVLSKLGTGVFAVHSERRVCAAVVLTDVAMGDSRWPKINCRSN
jgi:hypothetical protein